MHKAPFFAHLMLLSLGFGIPAGLSDQTARHRRGCLERLLAEQEAAWNRGDGPGWAANFTADADFINIRGELFLGREAIGRLHTMIFSGPYSGSSFSATIRQVTEVAPSVILLDADLAVTRYRALPPGIPASGRRSAAYANEVRSARGAGRITNCRRAEHGSSACAGRARRGRLLNSSSPL